MHIYKLPAIRQYAVKPGHRLVLQITSQSSESICPDQSMPFTSEPCGLTKPQKEALPGGKYKVYYSNEYPSVLKLPILPFNYFKSVNKGLPAQESNNGQNNPARNFTLPMSWH